MLLSLTQWLYDTTFILNILIFLILIFRKVVGHYLGAKWSYALWSTVAIKLLLPQLPYFSLFASSKEDAYLANAMPSMANLKLALTDTTLATAVISIWLLGVLGYGIYLTLTHRQFVKKIQQTPAVATIDISQRLTQFCKELNFKRAPRVIVTNEIHSAAVIGVVKPNLLIPPNFLELYTEEEQSSILRHELMHVKRHDLFYNWLAQFIRCLFWFNPFVHLAYHSYRLDQELSCDESVILNAEVIDRQLYGSAMLKTITSQNYASPASSCMWYSLKQLKDRITMLKFYKRSKLRTVLGISSLLIMFASALAIAAPINHVSNQVFNTVPALNPAVYTPAAANSVAPNAQQAASPAVALQGNGNYYNQNYNSFRAQSAWGNYGNYYANHSGYGVPRYNYANPYSYHGLYGGYHYNNYAYGGGNHFFRGR